MADVTMTLEEYEALRAMIGMTTPSATAEPVPKKRRAKKNPKLKAALKEANRRMRTSNGKLRKGRTQSDVMTLAHKLRKKM